MERAKSLGDLTGKKYGRLTVIKKDEEKSGRHIFWVCECSCGNTTTVRGDHIVSGRTRSCGCFKKENAYHTHGESKTRLFYIWSSMKERCNNPNNKRYNDYGGRGITISPEWQKYEDFRDWAYSSGYDESLTLDRVDVNGNYEPNNCRWATMKEQQRNRRNNVYITLGGEEKLLVEWCEIYGLPYDRIRERIRRRGWSVERAFNTPIRSTNEC